jgi:hypothetical protein
VTFTASAAGTYTITATYKPGTTDTIHATSSGTTTVTVNPAPEAKVTGGGQIAVNGGFANFGFVVQRKTTGSLPVGQLQFYNHATHENVHSVVIATLFVDPTKTKATFSGTCIDNGSPCTFTVYVEDNGEPGSKSSPKDKFVITINAGPPQGGEITKGNIQIH